MYSDGQKNHAHPELQPVTCTMPIKLCGINLIQLHVEKNLALWQYIFMPIRKFAWLLLFIMVLCNACLKAGPEALASGKPAASDKPSARIVSIFITAAAFSPDGKKAASGSDQGEVRLWSVPDGSLLFSLKPHQKAVRALAFGRNGDVLVSADQDGSVNIIDVPNGKVKYNVNLPAEVWDAVFTPDAKSILLTGADGIIRFYSLDLRKKLNEIKMNTGIYSAAFSPDGKLLALGGKDGDIYMLTYPGLSMETGLKGGDDVISGLAFSPDGKKLAASCMNERLSIWDVKNRKLLHMLHKHTCGVTSVAFCPDGKRVATSSTDDSVRIWDSEKGVQVSHRPLKDDVFAVCYSPDGKYLLSGSEDGKLLLWKGDAVFLTLGYSNAISGLVFSPDGRKLTVQYSSGVVKTWDAAEGTLLETGTARPQPVPEKVEARNTRYKAVPGDNFSIDLTDPSGKLLKNLKGHTGIITALAFSPEGRRLASGASGEEVIIWDISGGRPLVNLGELKASNRRNGIHALAMSPDGKKLAAGTEMNQIYIWNRETGEYEKTFTGHTDSVLALAWSPDGKYLASAGKDFTVQLRDENGNLLFKVKPHKLDIKTLEFTADGKYILTSSEDGLAKLLNAKNGDTTAVYTDANIFHYKEKPIIFASAISPDQKIIATGAGDRTVRLYDRKTGKVLKYFKEHTDDVGCVKFSPDGKLLAASSENGMLRVWDLASGKMITSIPSHRDDIWIFAWSPDGKKIATGGEDFDVKIWSIPDGRHLNTITGHSDFVQGVVWSPDGTKLYTGSLDNDVVKIWEPGNGKLLGILKAPLPEPGIRPGSPASTEKKPEKK
ncbi:MAG: WD40 repeat domain-containing protein [Chloroflexi bacterium]|nr:WD40 repeat domain-containing protein [Chloroflexota bacterium]